MTTLATRYSGATTLRMTAASRIAIRTATIGMIRSRSDSEMLADVVGELEVTEQARRASHRPKRRRASTSVAQTRDRVERGRARLIAAPDLGRVLDRQTVGADQLAFRSDRRCRAPWARSMSWAAPAAAARGGPRAVWS